MDNSIISGGFSTDHFELAVEKPYCSRSFFDSLNSKLSTKEACTLIWSPVKGGFENHSLVILKVDSENFSLCVHINGKMDRALNRSYTLTNQHDQSKLTFTMLDSGDCYIDQSINSTTTTVEVIGEFFNDPINLEFLDNWLDVSNAEWPEY